ncbi:sterigmatocystin 8-O-methyltransferase [Talaromyces proteolyticus]|uniref:Sterigmatocystin 8-O-methyltransferase n=1 Tax=Talaromyces proteolyticus TaxID=1131652 RepID=A0AAD4PYG5_9EURO|nr:sterigmatocystin 8-O-methyltransferase [Talaromyces proteolyticus]KAH8695143.1 sterigmatocystin 8-O-methyltransferase [Talaromyces proteolyticus]
MESLSAIEQYADQISRSAKTLSDYLRANNQPQPSFERYAPTSTLPASAPEDIALARRDLTEASFKIFQLAVGPSEFLPHLTANFHVLFALRWLCHFQIFSLVPLHGSISYTDLAAEAKVSERRLKSVARMAMTNNLFSEPTADTIAHSAISALLVTNPNFFDWARFMTEASIPTAAKLVEACERWPDSVKKNETAYNIAFDHDLPFFDHLAQDPERTRQFSGYMKSVTNSEGTDLKHLVAGFDWAKLGKATIVDVGGSTGHSSVELAKAYPDLDFVVQDLPEVVANGPEALQSQGLAESVTNRIRFQEHSFFEPEPLHGADVYLLRMILHDWPENEALSIVSNLIPALKACSRIIIMDTVLPASGQIPAVQERLLRVRDLTMLQVFNSLERATEDWTSLFKRADPRLKLKSSVQPLGSTMNVLEVVLEDEKQEVNQSSSEQVIESATALEGSLELLSATPVEIRAEL